MAKAILKSKKLWIMIIFTAVFLTIWRLGYFIHLPFIDVSLITSGIDSNNLFGFLDIYSGGALSNFSVLALGISPYITASIVIQLLQMDIVPKLKEWSEEGPSGKEKINQVTKYLALFLAFVQGLAISIGVSAQYGDILFEGIGNVNAFTYVYLALIITAGTAFCLWLAEKITKRGIGNGSSLLIVAGIVATFPPMINDLIKSFISAEGAGVGDAFIFVGVILLLILIIIGIVFMEGAQRRIPIQYANRPAAASFRGKSDSNIPIKLNSASVIPVIFASTLMSIPTTIANFLDTGSRAYYWIVEIFSSTKPIGFALYIILIYTFSFFYSFLQMNPDNMAENLQKQNAYIPGIRPGDETASYISRVLFKITMVGSTYLALVAITPIIMTWIFKLPGSIQIGGTGLIIVVGVALETAKQLKTETEEKQYRGFLE